MNGINKSSIPAGKRLADQYFKSQYSPHSSKYSSKPGKPLQVHAKPLQLEDAKKLLKRCQDMIFGRAKKLQIQYFTKQKPTTEKSGLNLMKKYEKMIGLVEVQHAQGKVLQCNKGLLESMQERRVVTERLLDIQRRIKVGKTENGNSNQIKIKRRTINIFEFC